MSVTCTAVLPVREEAVSRLTGLLDAERIRCGTRARTWSLPCRDQAIPTLRWFYDGTRIKLLAADNRISVGGNIQVITVGDGRPIWTSPVRPGREHDTTALRTYPELLPCLREAGADLRALGDLGYEGESSTITVAFKKPKNSRLPAIQQQSNKAHNSL